VANIGGTLAKHIRRGDRVIGLTLTYGVEVHTERLIGKSEAEIKKIVRQESIDAARFVGLEEFRFLDFGDTPLVMTRENLQQLADVMQEIRPDLIICAHYPFREDQHGGDHGEAARMVERAPAYRHHGGKAPYRLPVIYFSMVETMFFAHATPHVPDTYVDTTDTIEQKVQACIATWKMVPPESEKTANLIRSADRHFGACAGVPYAEGFETVRRASAVEYLSV